MKRSFLKILSNWKDHPLRRPLIVRGARQVGKTFIIEAFGRQQFKNLVSINLEQSPVFQKCFEDLDPRSIVNQIEILSNEKITPGSTLVFFDEIQQCPNAIKSLRYFKEQLPELHVIAAGSLLEFAIKDEDFSFPVGRIQFAKLYPLSFAEFLEAKNDHSLLESLSTYDLSKLPPKAIHDHCLAKLEEYFIVGGMPASIMAFLKTNSYLEAKYVQKSLWDAFEADFGKYSTKTQHRYLKKLFEEGPKLIGTQVKYSKIDPELPNPSRDMKLAIELLRLAGLLHPITATSAGGIPLLKGAKQSIFKLLFLDIGLVEQVMNIDPQNPDLLTGPLSEQFVGQEILAYSDPLLDERLFFWIREKPNSSAEVDYIIEYKGVIFPLEVKAGKAGKLKSLRVFTEEKKSPFAIRISQDELGFEKGVLSIPLYMISQMHRLIAQALDATNSEN